MTCATCSKIRGAFGGSAMDVKADLSAGVQRFQKWTAAPVTANMDLMSVVLTTILVVSVAYLWTRVLKALD